MARNVPWPQIGRWRGMYHGLKYVWECTMASRGRRRCPRTSLSCPTVRSKRHTPRSTAWSADLGTSSIQSPWSLPTTIRSIGCATNRSCQCGGSGIGPTWGYQSSRGPPRPSAWPHRLSAVLSAASSVWSSAGGSSSCRCRSVAAEAASAMGSWAPVSIRSPALGLAVVGALQPRWPPSRHAAVAVAAAVPARRWRWRGDECGLRWPRAWAPPLLLPLEELRVVGSSRRSILPYRSEQGTRARFRSVAGPHHGQERPALWRLREEAHVLKEVVVVDEPPFV